MSEEQMNDSTFGRLFIIMIIAMTVLSVSLAIIAVNASSDVNEKLDERKYEENKSLLIDRIKPVGQIADGTAKEKEVVKVELSPEEAAYATCSACHSSGVPGVPQIGNKTQWSARISKGMDALYNSAINGIGTMPPKGGMASLSDADVKLAVEFMVKQSK